MREYIISFQIPILNKAINNLENISEIKDFEPLVSNDFVSKIRRFKSIEINRLVSVLYSKLKQ